MECHLYNSCTADLDEMVKEDYVIGFKLLNSDYNKLRILKNDVSDYDSDKVYESSEEENCIKAVIKNEIFEEFNLESDKDEASTNTHFDPKQDIPDRKAPIKNENYIQEKSSFALISSISQNISNLRITKPQIKNEKKLIKLSLQFPQSKLMKINMELDNSHICQSCDQKVKNDLLKKAEFKKRLNYNSSCKAIANWTQTRSAKDIAKYLYCLKQENITQQD